MVLKTGSLKWCSKRRVANEAEDNKFENALRTTIIKWRWRWRLRNDAEDDDFEMTSKRTEFEMLSQTSFEMTLNEYLWNWRMTNSSDRSASVQARQTPSGSWLQREKNSLASELPREGFWAPTITFIIIDNLTLEAEWSKIQRRLKIKAKQSSDCLGQIFCHAVCRCVKVSGDNCLCWSIAPGAARAQITELLPHWYGPVARARCLRRQAPVSCLGNCRHVCKTRWNIGGVRATERRAGTSCLQITSDSSSERHFKLVSM